MKRTFVLVTSVLVAAFTNYKASAQSDDLVNVYRWMNSKDNDYVTVADGEFQEGQMINWGWKDKVLAFVAYRSPAPGRVAVYSWYNPSNKDYASIAEDEFTDDQMLKMGYTGKKLQFYALTRRGPNEVAVYRWRHEKDWATIPEEGDTDAYIKKGFKHKTFQYYGIARSMDAPIYDQL